MFLATVKAKADSFLPGVDTLMSVCFAFHFSFDQSFETLYIELIFLDS